VNSNKSVSDDAHEIDDRIAERLSKILQRVLRDGRDDVELEGDTGVNRHTIRAYRTKTRKPSLAAGLVLAAAAGEWAVNKLLNTVQYQATPLDPEDKMQPAQIVGEALTHLAVIGRAAADNRIDHIEEPQTTEAADMLIATVLPLSSAGRAG